MNACLLSKLFVMRLRVQQVHLLLLVLLLVLVVLVSESRAHIACGRHSQSSQTS